jgi:mannose-1-phosphate guanylyltransferase
LENNSQKVALILAGGSDMNLWPISNDNKPKQFSHFLGEGTLLQNTYDRLINLYENENIYISTIVGYEKYVLEQIPDLKKQNLILEPFLNGSLSALMLANSIISKRHGEDTNITIFPSDHLIISQIEFLSSLEKAINCANLMNGLVVLGIEPNAPLEKLGYIQYSKINSNSFNKKENLNENKILKQELIDLGLRKIITFAEKPDKESAKRFLLSGDFLWNTGIISIKSNILVDEFRNLFPYESNLFSNLMNYIDNRNFDLQVNLLYRRLKPMSIESGILEKKSTYSNKNLFTLKTDFDWLDLDNWAELYLESKKDPKGNVLNGSVISLNSKNSLVITENLNIAIIGLEDVVVVEHNGSLLICNRNQVQDVKEVYKEIKRKKIQ